MHTEAAGNLGVSVLMDCSCLGGTHAAVVLNVDIVHLLDPGVTAGGEEKAAQLGWLTRQARCLVVVNVDIVDWLDARVAAGGEEKAAQLGRSTRLAGW